MSTDQAHSGAGKYLPMDVHNVGFLLDRLGQDCHPLQFLRELNQNGKEAIDRAGGTGEIIWDVDWIQYDLGDGETMKLCVVDNGDGMTGDEMIHFINQLSSSHAVQSLSSNYGVGAKISAATRNPAGVVYQSWKNGEGWMIHLEKMENGEYGLRQWELQDGTFSYCLPIDDAIKPEIIDKHGTKVILYGEEDDSNTMLAPSEAAAPSRWVSKYLNTRFFKFPDGIEVRAREGWDFPRGDKDRNVLRKISGQKQYLDNHAVKSGVHSLDAVHVHWWILKDEPALTNNSGYIESAGHTAALYQDELYDRRTARAGTAMLQQFGVLFGYRTVVLYIEPVAGETDVLTTNTPRTSLLLNGDGLPWADWAHEFRQNMPKELADFVNEKASATTEKDHVKSIKERLKGVMDLYRVSRYRPTPQGVYLSDPSSSVPLTSSADATESKKGAGGSQTGSSASSKTKGRRDSEVGNIYHLFEKKDGVPSNKVQTDPFPIVQWVTVKDDSRAVGEMEDKAAKFLADQNMLFVNADFRVFQDMVKRLRKEKSAGQGVDIEKVVTDVVHQWFEQALVETIIGIQQLKGSKEWGPDLIEKALSEEALTATVMQRYHVFIACKRDLGAKLGKTINAEN